MIVNRFCSCGDNHEIINAGLALSLFSSKNNGVWIKLADDNLMLVQAIEGLTEILDPL